MSNSDLKAWVSVTCIHFTAQTVLTELNSVAIPIHPGTVETDMARSVFVDEQEIRSMGGITSEESAKSVLTLIDEATVEKDGGVFRSYDGSIIPW
jgi:hypothetical protein